MHCFKIFRFALKYVQRCILLFRFRKYIKNGIYCFDGKHLTKKWQGTLLRKIYNTSFVISFIKDKNISTSGYFYYGSIKTCYYDGKSLFCYCKDKSIYLMNRKHYELYSNSCPYPYAKTYWFDDKTQFMCVDYIKGVHYSDPVHLIKWAKAALTMACKATFEIRDGTLYYVQHGDAWFNNYIWTDDDRFVYIDLDRLGLWPALYDIIYGFVVAFNYEAFSMIDNHLYSEIELLFEKHFIPFSTDILDYYYTCFMTIWKNRGPQFYSKYIAPFNALDERYKMVHDFLRGCTYDEP